MKNKPRVVQCPLCDERCENGAVVAMGMLLLLDCTMDEPGKLDGGEAIPIMYFIPEQKQFARASYCRKCRLVMLRKDDVRLKPPSIDEIHDWRQVEGKPPSIDEI